jgi:flagellar basal body-associated protein FliL
MGQGASLMDLLISLLQSIVVLLLASGVYVALVVRRSKEPSPKPEPEAPAVGRYPRSVT